MSIEIGGRTLPIEQPSDLVEAIESVSYLHTIKLDSDDDNDDNDQEIDRAKATKKRKHKRSKNK